MHLNASLFTPYILIVALPIIRLILGEKVDDLANFDAEKFAIGLFQGLI